jgi:hypothetical protein
VKTIRLDNDIDDSRIDDVNLAGAIGRGQATTNKH